MPTYSADQFIGKTLIACNNVDAYYSFATGKKKIIYKGQPIGVVTGWIQKYSPDKKLWWMFTDKSGLNYFVKNTSNVCMTKYDKETMQTVEQKVKDYKEQQEANKERGFIYYVEKWGKKILIGAAITYVAVEGFKAYQNGKQKSNS